MLSFRLHQVTGEQKLQPRRVGFLVDLGLLGLKFYLGRKVLDHAVKCGLLGGQLDAVVSLELGLAVPKNHLLPHLGARARADDLLFEPVLEVQILWRFWTCPA